MHILDVPVISNKEIAKNTFLLEVERNILFDDLRAGQFFNIRVSDTDFPLLRRPFSISDINETSIFFMYKVVGGGTEILSKKKNGDKVNLLGPLGNSFNLQDKYEHAIFIGGGIGIAPFPITIKQLNNDKDYSVIFGVRTKNEVHDYGMSNINYCSDNGSIGLKGNVIDLLDEHLEKLETKNVKLFACGPNPMFRALQKYVYDKNLECEVSMESAMACGFGICQGCPVEYKDSESYKLICKDGPVFNIRDIEI